MKTKQADDSLRIQHAFGRIDECHGYRSGIILTPHGIVYGYSQKEGPHAMLDFVCRGRLHMRTFKRDFTARGLAAKASQFAKQLTHRNDARKAT